MTLEVCLERVCVEASTKRVGVENSSALRLHCASSKELVSIFDSVSFCALYPHSTRM